MPTSYSRIKELAARIQAQTTELDEQLSSYGLPSPTFETSAVDELPPALHGVQNSLLEAADELILLVRGPLYNLMDLASYSVSSSPFAMSLLYTGKWMHLHGNSETHTPPSTPSSTSTSRPPSR